MLLSYNAGIVCWCCWWCWCWRRSWYPSRCSCITDYVIQRVCILTVPIPYQVLWIDLVLLKHNEYGGVCDIVHAAVVEVFVSTILGRRPAVLRRTSGVASHQHPGQEHGSHGCVTGVVVGVCGIPGKVTTWIWKQKWNSSSQQVLHVVIWTMGYITVCYCISNKD